MLDKYFSGCFQGVEHVGAHKSKGEVCKKIRADVMVDDNIKHLMSAAEVGVGKLIWFGYYPWQNNGDFVTGIVRCGDWLDVRREIEAYANG